MSAQEALEQAGHDSAVKLMPLASLYPAPWNPRTITEERLRDLRKSMEADPEHLWARPVMHREDGMVIGGNQRLAAANLDLTDEGGEGPYASLPAVLRAGLTDEEAKLIALRDNQGYGVWNDAQVAEILGELGSAGMDLDLSGFSSEERTSLLDGFQADPGEGAPDPDDAPPLPKTARSQLGEVYELGPHRLICGDARSPEVIAKLCGDDKIDVIWTDPPYGVDYVGKTADALTIQNDGADEAGPLLEGVLRAIDDYVKPGARYYIASPDGPIQAEWLRILLANGWRYHQTCVWVKNTMVLGHSDYHFRHEDIIYGWKPGKGRTGRGAHAGTRWYGDNSQVTTFFIDRPSRSSEHPTMKPIELITPMLKNSSRRNDVILDPFGGSGSTLIACETVGRRCLMVALSPNYCDVIRDRYERIAGLGRDRLMDWWLDDGDVRIALGDARDRLQDMEERSAQCLVTSPPFWALRDYGEPGQIGLEETPEEWVRAVVTVMGEARRVLRRDGVAWIEVGDTYATRWSSVRNSGRAGYGDESEPRVRKGPSPSGFKGKDLIGAPWMLAFALRADGWYLRAESIWHKPNGMPESADDRPTRTHTQVFLLSSSPHYYYDRFAVLEPHTPDGRKQTSIAATGAGVTTHENYANRKGAERWPHAGRNLRSVWTIPTAPTKHGHHATYPVALAAKCILAGTSEHGGCAVCGAPYRRLVDEQFVPQQDASAEAGVRGPGDASNGWEGSPRGTVNVRTLGWEQSCRCDAMGAEPRPQVVIDPFMGSGVTALAARTLGRHAVGVELSEPYLRIARDRLQQLSLLA